MTARRCGLLVVLVAVSGGLPYGASRLWRVLSDRTALTEIQGQIEAGRHVVAARNLAKVLAQDPGSDEAAYLLGSCEKALGRTEAARKAWARVPAGSRFGVLAVMGRAKLEVDAGRFADAEDLVNESLRDPGVDGSDLRRFLAPLFWHEGRGVEAWSLVEANWHGLNRAGRGGSGQAIELVRLHILLSVGSTSLDVLNRFLERAASLSPEDDRVWLGRANLAIRRRAFDEASRLLVSCLRRRPLDVPVWRARLDWAMATDRVDVARECLTHLPVEKCTPGEVYKLEAWLAEKRGHVQSEWRALDLLIAAEPAEGAALERLAVLADRGNRSGLAAEFRGRKTEIDQMSGRYKELFLRDQLLRNAKEMARLASRLGRIFEARVFWSVAVAAEPDRGDLRKELAALRQPEALVATPGQTVAEVIASRLDKSVPASSP